jgi:hypothetical protein
VILKKVQKLEKENIKNSAEIQTMAAEIQTLKGRVHDVENMSTSTIKNVAVNVLLFYLGAQPKTRISPPSTRMNKLDAGQESFVQGVLNKYPEASATGNGKKRKRGTRGKKLADFVILANRVIDERNTSTHYETRAALDQAIRSSLSILDKMDSSIRALLVNEEFILTIAFDLLSKLLSSSLRL